MKREQAEEDGALAQGLITMSMLLWGHTQTS